MIAYFETSAIIPLLIPEITSALCEEIWDNADAVVTSLITRAEAAAALARAERIGRIDNAQHRMLIRKLDTIWEQMQTVAVDEAVVLNAAELSAQQKLRGYDAVQCATAAGINSTSMVAITGDRELADAWRDLGVYTIDTAELSQRC